MPLNQGTKSNLTTNNWKTKWNYSIRVTHLFNGIDWLSLYQLWFGLISLFNGILTFKGSSTRMVLAFLQKNSNLIQSWGDIYPTSHQIGFDMKSSYNGKATHK